MFSFLENKNVIKKILFTLGILFIYRLGTCITIPGIYDVTSLLKDNSIFEMLGVLSGGTFKQMSLFSLGVGPYISASIIIEILSTDYIPIFKSIKEEGNSGRKKLNQYMRYLALVIALIQGFLLSYRFAVLVDDPSFTSYCYIAIVFAAGSMSLLWLADRITVHGIGNGVSIIIFSGIVAELPSTFANAYEFLAEKNILYFFLYLIGYLLIIVGVILVQKAERRIPIQQTSTSTYSKSSNLSHLPIKINNANVMPVIIASLVVQVPPFVISLLSEKDLSNIFSFENWYILLVYFLLIIACTFLYTNTQINPKNISDNLNKQGQYIPGIRPGLDTEKYIRNVLNSVTTLGSVLLALLAITPYLMVNYLNIPYSISLGGTGVIIMVGVAIDTVTSLQSQYSKRKYKGV